MKNNDYRQQFSSYRVPSTLLGLFYLALTSLAFPHQVAESTSAYLPQASTDKQVLLTVTVTDKQGNPVPNLPQSTFAVFDQKIQQDITFFSDRDMPQSVAIIFDLSRSTAVNSRRIALAKRGLARFVELSHVSNEYLILSFDKQPRIVTDVTQDTSMVMKAVNDLIPNQNIVGAALYDTCYLAIEKLMKSAQPKRVMILVSNGQDIESRHEYLELRRFLQQSGILLYSVGIMNINDAGLSQFGRAVLDEISRLSGGRAYYPVTEADMNESFERIANELRHQYLIGFRSTSVAKEGKIHKLQVEVKTTDKKQKVKVRAREGY